ncbi:hypothetical protein Tco_0997417 [Tanacetum coccineum]
MQKVILFYNGLEVPTRQILNSKGVIPSKTAADAKVAIQEMVEYSQKWHNRTSRTRRPYYTKDFPLKEEGKTLEEAYYTQFGRPFQGRGYRAAAPRFYQRNNANPTYQERRQSMEGTLSKFMSESAKRHEENSNMIKEIRASRDAAIQNQGALIKTLEIQIRQMSKVLQEKGFGSLPSSTKANPRDHVKSISTTVKADTNLIRRMGSSQYAVSTLQNNKLIHETRQTTILLLSRLNDYYCEEKKGSYGPKFLEANSYKASHINNFIPQKEKDPGSFTLPCYINNVCFDNALADLGASLKRDQVDDLMPTIEEGDVVEKVKARNDRNMDIVEDMDPYLDEGMGEVVVGKPFYEVSCVETKRFDGMITIHGEDECVTYQMVQSHPRFKHHINGQCNKIPPLLKVSEQDVMNVISHSYQKLNGFYKRVLNLGPKYIRDAKMEEWLTRGHVSVHEMEE